MQSPGMQLIVRLTEEELAHLELCAQVMFNTAWEEVMLPYVSEAKSNIKLMNATSEKEAYAIESKHFQANVAPTLNACFKREMQQFAAEHKEVHPARLGQMMRWITNRIAEMIPATLEEMEKRGFHE